MSDTLAGTCKPNNVTAPLAAQGAHGSLADRVRFGCPRWTEQDLHVVGLEDGVEGAGVPTVPVAEKEAQGIHAAVRCHGEVPRLLNGPLGGGVRGDTGEVDSSGVVLDEDQGVQALEGDGVEVQEVGGEDAVGLGGEEFTPGRAGALRSGSDAGGAQDLPDRGRG
ncbi:hypothetical protein, partial [Streptomyces viridosporus]|uniref:hypothetical protein n=1 Tax=Streptomyces viridosporus TaxID=67581 RepID=UPI003D9EC056